MGKHCKCHLLLAYLGPLSVRRQMKKKLEGCDQGVRQISGHQVDNYRKIWRSLLLFSDWGCSWASAGGSAVWFGLQGRCCRDSSENRLYRWRGQHIMVLLLMLHTVALSVCSRWSSFLPNVRLALVTFLSPVRPEIIVRWKDRKER